MNRRTIRSIAAVGVFALVVTGLYSSVATGAPKPRLKFLTQPTDAEVGDLIRASDLDDNAPFVKVQVTDENGVPTATQGVLVGFRLATGSGFASGDLHVIPQLTDATGVATFTDVLVDGELVPSLWIGTENEPQFTDFALRAVSEQGQPHQGDTSTGFDVWEDGQACSGGADCVANLRNGRDKYELDAFVSSSLGASELPGVTPGGVLPGLTCAKQKTIFPNTVFSYETTETDGAPFQPVKLTTIITSAEWKASANNGQAHADWCIGLVNQSDWAASGATPKRLNTDGVGGLDLWVALAPKCPPANPSASAPCIVSQNPDGFGGSITIGWLPGGDPPRRT